jgi:hypothetical protein
MYGKSVSNQWIEAWWGILRKECADWWIRYFKDLRDSGLYSDNDAIQRECLKFCFMDILHKELHRVARLWNLHRIPPSFNMESPELAIIIMQENNLIMPTPTPDEAIVLYGVFLHEIEYKYSSSF